jgi:putative tryptophan/tyrosine transport system substrate-binding protein
MLGTLAAPLAVEAQPGAKVHRIGFLGQGSGPGVEPFLAGLHDLGYVQGKNIVVEFRWAEGRYERLPALAAELVGLNVDVLVTGGTPGVRAAKQATTTIPIVMTMSGDAVASGLVDSLARPGSNVTGSTFFSPELMAKRIELLKEAMPRASRVAALVHAGNPGHVPMLEAMRTTSRSLKIEIHEFAVRGPNEFATAFSAMTKSRVDAIVVQEDSVLTANAVMIADAAAKRRLPQPAPQYSRRPGVRLGTG